jgi:hypothetical protein
MSKLKKALAKADENRGFDNQKVIRGGIRPAAAANLRTDKVEQKKAKLDISYSKTKVQKIENNVLKKGKVFSHFYDTQQIDQIKTLRTQILNSLDKIHGNSFLVTSANPYEGKTFTSINLGVSIAQEMHRTVLIVDCDLKSHTKKHKQFAQDFFVYIRQFVDLETGRAGFVFAQKAAQLTPYAQPKMVAHCDFHLSAEYSFCLFPKEQTFKRTIMSRSTKTGH